MVILVFRLWWWFATDAPFIFLISTRMI
jgi:hypothetical protein